MVFVDFYADWCGPCKLLDQTTWKDPKVIKLLTEKTIPLRLDVERNQDLARKYQIAAIPSLLLLKPDGSVTVLIVGYKDGPTLAATLEESLAKSVTNDVRKGN